MPFYQCEITVDPATNIDELSEYLENYGAVSVTLQDAADQPILEPPPQTTPLWHEIKLTALFIHQAELDEALQYIQLHYPEITDCTTSILEDQDWLTQSTIGFKPLCITNKLWIHSEWELPPPDQLPKIQLNPGLAFGTGTHPTTAMCLEWLTTQSLEHKTLIDYGCGSGILAIAALKLGIREAYAVDIDPQALTACRNNAGTNHISDHALHIMLPNALPVVQCDILIANILAKPLLELLTTFVNLLKPNGAIVLTGIVTAQEAAILERYQPYFKLHVWQRRDEWSVVCGKIN